MMSGSSTPSLSTPATLTAPATPDLSTADVLEQDIPLQDLSVDARRSTDSYRSRSSSHPIHLVLSSGIGVLAQDAAPNAARYSAEDQRRLQDVAQDTAQHATQAMFDASQDAVQHSDAGATTLAATSHRDSRLQIHLLALKKCIVGVIRMARSLHNYSWWWFVLLIMGSFHLATDIKSWIPDGSTQYSSVTKRDLSLSHAGLDGYFAQADNEERSLIIERMSETIDRSRNLYRFDRDCAAQSLRHELSELCISPAVFLATHPMPKFLGVTEDKQILYNAEIEEMIAGWYVGIYKT